MDGPLRGCVACPPLPGARLRPDALRLPNSRSGKRQKRPTIPSSCLEEFARPQVGEFEVAIREVRYACLKLHENLIKQKLLAGAPNMRSNGTLTYKTNEQLELAGPEQAQRSATPKAT